MIVAFLVSRRYRRHGVFAVFASDAVKLANLSAPGKTALRDTLLQAAKQQFYREYRHGVVKPVEFDESFSRLELARKHLKLERPCSAEGSELFERTATLVTERRAVVVHSVASSNMERHVQLLREAMLLHLLRHDRIVPLLFVCMFELVLAAVTDC